MNLPISLTLLRIFFVPLLVVLLLTKGENLDLWAVAVFLSAALTDLLDGYLARRRRQITTLGDRKSTRLNSSHIQKSRMPSSA